MTRLKPAPYGGATRKHEYPAEMTAAEFLAQYRRRGSKYNNVPTMTDAGMADSKAEAARWGELRLLEQGGVISDLRFHPRYQLPGGITYEADSSYTEDGRQVVEDVKGGKVRTGVFRLKWRLMAETYPDVDLRIVER
jgi:hypothetical protein